MEKYIYNEKNGLWYELQGDYYLPCLKLPEDGTVHIGIWGQRHRRYLKTHRKTLYTSLELFFRLVKQMAEAEGVTETLKADDPMEWVGRMNNIRNRATEIVNTEIILC